MSSNVAKTGASFTAFICILIVDSADVSSESEAVKEKLSLPL